MGRDHAVDGDTLLAKGGRSWVPRCDRAHESPEGLEREDITGIASTELLLILQTDIHNLFSQQTLLSTYRPSGIVLGAGMQIRVRTGLRELRRAWHKANPCTSPKNLYPTPSLYR